MKHFKNNKQRVFISELFDMLSNASNQTERVEILHEYTDSSMANGKIHAMTLRGIVESVFHPDVVMALPETTPPFEEFKDGPTVEMAPKSLFNAVRSVPFFVEGTDQFIQNKLKRETFFIKQLESMFIDEAQIFLMMKDKKITGYKGITENLFRKAFPDWLPADTGKGGAKK